MLLKNISLFGFALPSALGSRCTSAPSEPEYRNNEPINDANLEYISTSRDANVGGGAILYRAGVGTGRFNLLHVYGTSYQMGYHHGRILKDEVVNLLETLMNMIYDEAYSYACQTKLFANRCILRPGFVKNVMEFGVNGVFDMTFAATEPWTYQWHSDEMQGLADGSGVTLDLVKRIHMIGEVTKAQCSLFGIWDEALQDGSGLLQLRALDWTTDDIFVNNPQVTIYHPTYTQEYEGFGKLRQNQFANVGFPGWIGLMTGMNDQKMGISEIGASTAGDSPDFPGESRTGQAFTWTLRDMLQFDMTGDAAVSRLENTERTCNLILGMGDGKNESQSMYGLASDNAKLTVMTDKNMLPQTYDGSENNGDFSSTEHDRIDKAVYWGMDWYCTGYHKVLGDRIRENYGNINAEVAIRDIVAATNTGNLHIAIYDFNRNDMYVSFHRQSKYNETDAESPKDAWKRSYTRLDMDEIFGELLDGCICGCENGSCEEDLDLDTGCYREYLPFGHCVACDEGYEMIDGLCNGSGLVKFALGTVVLALFNLF